MYSVHQWCPSDYSLDGDRCPRDHVEYQYDCSGDTYYSLPYPDDIEYLLFHNDKDSRGNAYNLFHFTDKQSLQVRMYLSLHMRQDLSQDLKVEDLSYVAFTQRYCIGNRKVGDLIFNHLFRNGVSVEEIMDYLRYGPYPDIDDGQCPHLERSLKALARRAEKE